MNTKLNLFLFSIIIIISGCSVNPTMKYYNSRLGANFVSVEELSNLELIDLESESDISRNLAFVIAKNASIEGYQEDYLLIFPAPEAYESHIIMLNNLDYSRAVFLNREKLVEFINVLQRTSNNWDKKLDVNEGLCYSFHVYEEQNQILSKDISNQDVSVKVRSEYDYEFSFYFQRFHYLTTSSTTEKSIATISGRYFPTIQIIKKMHIDTLLEILQIALEKMPEPVENLRRQKTGSFLPDKEKT
ncbi:MAG: hypothetical protein K9N06_11320 [Candidatus Cloacimonetes bacterium]|nr:hypothetical protein [Candidatus Cloacimonadota bacterium]